MRVLFHIPTDYSHISSIFYALYYDSLQESVDNKRLSNFAYHKEDVKIASDS
jgi:hypothetical protein